MRKQAEQRKAEILRHLQQSGGKSKPSEVLEAEKVIAQFHKREQDRIAQLQRAQSPLPPGDTCPDCFVERGVTSHMHPIPYDDNAPDIDLFKCRECGLVIEVKP